MRGAAITSRYILYCFALFKVVILRLRSHNGSKEKRDAHIEDR